MAETGECLIGRAYDRLEGGGLSVYPPFSVDVAALCGPPRTDTPANESNLVSTSQRNSVSTSLHSPEQSTPPLIFQHSFYLNANTAQHVFSQGGFEREILGKMERRKVKGGETDKVRKTSVFSRFPLAWCNSPTGRRVAFSEPPSRTSKQNLISKPPYTQQKHLESNTGKPVSVFLFEPEAELF